MSLHGKLTAVMCVLALALGLAACGEGSGIATVSVDTAEDQRKTVSSAIQAARNAVGALGDDATEAELAAAAGAIEAASKAVSDADALAASERRAHANTVSLLEENLASARARIASVRDLRRREMATEARALTAAFAGPRITDIGAMVGHETPPVMSGTVPGTPAVSVADLATAAAGGASTVEGWKGGRYTAADEDAGTADTVVLYTNIAPPGSRPFSGEGGKYGADVLDADGNLPIAGNADATLIAASGFPSGPGIRTHEPGAGGTVLVEGLFDGAPGTYVCTPADGGACTSSIKSGGGYDLTGGWKFVPAAGALVPEPDGEYQYFGLWLRELGDVYTLGVFHGGDGGAADEFADLAALQGRASYRGPAAGKFAILRQLGEAEAGDFTATARLAVDFGDGTEPGTVTGEIDGFMVGGRAKDWEVELGSAAIGTHGAIASGGSETALTRWTIGDSTAETTATWSGRFHDADQDRTPVVATGVFEAVHGTIGRMTGAFGTTRQ